MPAQTEFALSQSQVKGWLQPDWNIPGVRAYVTTRQGRFNQAPYDGFNTAAHVNDHPADVATARAALADYFRWNTPPQWLDQVHGTTVIQACPDNKEPQADAVYSAMPGQICTIHTADCLPVFFATKNGAAVALAHAGWRGLAAGILEATVKKLSAETDQIAAWLGPAIGPSAFEVGDEVRDAFVSIDAAAKSCFHRNANHRWQCDLYGLAKQRLNKIGITSITGGGHCTYSDARFFSYRKQPVTGRLLSMIWIDPAQ